MSFRAGIQLQTQEASEADAILGFASPGATISHNCLSKCVTANLFFFRLKRSINYFDSLIVTLQQHSCQGNVQGDVPHVINN